MLQLGGLSDKQIDEICSRPRITREEIFGKADKWLKRNKMILEREYPGRYVLINAGTLAGVAGENYKDAHALYNQKYGPTPPDGRSFLGKQF